MAHTTPMQAFPVPDESDTPDVPRDMSALALAVEKRVMGVYASTSARDTAISSPAPGQFAYISGTNQVTVYTSGAWANYPPSQVSITSGTTVPSNSTGNNGDIFFKV